MYLFLLLLILCSSQCTHDICKFNLVSYISLYGVVDCRYSFTAFIVVYIFRLAKVICCIWKFFMRIFILQIIFLNIPFTPTKSKLLVYLKKKKEILKLFEQSRGNNLYFSINFFPTISYSTFLMVKLFSLFYQIVTFFF